MPKPTLLPPQRPHAPSLRRASPLFRRYSSTFDPGAAERIKNSCGAERSGAAIQFYVELSRLPGNLEFNQEGLLLQE